MITTFTTRRLACAPLAAVLLAAGCTSPYCRLPQPPASYKAVDSVTHEVQGNRHDFSLAGMPDLAEAQASREGCWAACATMIHRWEHDDMTQAEIDARIHERAGDEDDAATAALTDSERAARIRAASEHEILLALTPDRKAQLDALWAQCFTRVGEALGEELAAQTDEEREAAKQKLAGELARALVTRLSYLSNTMDLDTVMADLQEGQPVVVGLQETDPQTGETYGHACVIYGLVATWKQPDGVADGLAAAGNAMLGAGGSGYGFRSESGYTYLTAKVIDPDGETTPDHQPRLREIAVADLLARADFFASRPFAERVLDAQAQLLQQPAAGNTLVAAGPAPGGSP